MIEAKVDEVDGVYRILATKDGESLYLGNNIDGLLFRYVEYRTEKEAINHIKQSENLCIKESSNEK